MKKKIEQAKPIEVKQDKPKPKKLTVKDLKNFKGGAAGIKDTHSEMPNMC